MERIHYAEVPPCVEYSIIPYGETVISIVDVMKAWEEKQMAVIGES
ncbi:MAG: winged helix-turn-helix transcriptional regulator [Chloroflexota bacterium]